MKDPVLDIQVHEVTLLMSELKSFRDIIVTTLNTEVVVSENETRLAKLREKVPEMSRKLYSDLCEGYDDTAEEIVNSVLDLSKLIKFTDLEKRKLLERWHKYYMKLYFMIGKLTSRKEKVESLNMVKLKTRAFLFSPATIIVIIAIIIFLVFMSLAK